jgi:hypothetical protein
VDRRWEILLRKVIVATPHSTITIVNSPGREKEKRPDGERKEGERKEPLEKKRGEAFLDVRQKS